MNDLHQLIPQRSADAHKGRAGHVLLVAGQRGMAGAATLAARGALRGGAGLVTVATPAAVEPVVASKLDDAMTLPVGAHSDAHLTESGGRTILDAIDQRDVLGLGPGLGTHVETERLVRTVLTECRRPLVLDADGLNLLAALDLVRPSQAGPWILTPHPGEMARLLGTTAADVQADRVGAATTLATKHDAIVLLKGAGTIITDGARTVTNTTGNPGLATGGSGDVLTGIITALLAQGLAPFDAARLGAHLHGLAGDLAAAALGQLAMTASDVVDHLPPAWQKLEASS